MHDSVPSPRYSAICNVLRQWKTSLIPTYRVYRLYDIITELTVTTIKHQDIKQRTGKQSNSILWHQVRTRCITVSKCGCILCTKKCTENLLISVLYPRPMCYPPKPIEWGWNNEDRAIRLMRLT